MKRYEMLSATCVMAIFAHPDDAEAAAGGTLALFADAGAKVVLVTVAQGDKGRGESKDRQAEGKNAAEILGISVLDSLDFNDGEFDNDIDLRKKLTESIRDFQPEIIICPDPTAVFFAHAYINHRDHRETGWAVIDVVSSAVGNKKYFSKSTPHDVSQLLCAGSLEPTCVVDITQAIDRKISAVQCYKSQIGDQIETVAVSLVESARNVGHTIQSDFGEAFRFISMSESSDLH